MIRNAMKKKKKAGRGHKEYDGGRGLLNNVIKESHWRR